jgi:hypothetical protein
MRNKLIIASILSIGCIGEVHAATLSGNSTGSFVNPAPGTATVTGVGTNNFTWGSGTPSTLSFTPIAFSGDPNQVFSIGKLDFFNGIIAGGSEADSVDLSLNITFSGGPTINRIASFSLVNTTNTSDPIESADIVSLVSGGFTLSSFNVLEEVSAQADLLVKFTTSGNDLQIVGFGNPSGGGFVTGGTSVPEPFTIIGSLIGGTAALRMRKKLKSNHKV